MFCSYFFEFSWFSFLRVIILMFPMFLSTAFMFSFRLFSSIVFWHLLLVFTYCIVFHLLSLRSCLSTTRLPTPTLQFVSSGLFLIVTSSDSNKFVTFMLIFSHFTFKSFLLSILLLFSVGSTDAIWLLRLGAMFTLFLDLFPYRYWL